MSLFCINHVPQALCYEQDGYLVLDWRIVNHKWSPWSPDLTALNIFWCVNLKADMYPEAPTTREYLKVQQACVVLDQDEIKCVTQSVGESLRQFLSIDGQHFEFCGVFRCTFKISTLRKISCHYWLLVSMFRSTLWT